MCWVEMGSVVGRSTEETRTTTKTMVKVILPILVPTLVLVLPRLVRSEPPAQHSTSPCHLLVYDPHTDGAEPEPPTSSSVINVETGRGFWSRANNASYATTSAVTRALIWSMRRRTWRVRHESLARSRRCYWKVHFALLGLFFWEFGLGICFSLGLASRSLVCRKGSVFIMDECLMKSGPVRSGRCLFGNQRPPEGCVLDVMSLWGGWSPGRFSLGTDSFSIFITVVGYHSAHLLLGPSFPLHFPPLF